jgi:mannose-1-phosphate guanylyltransferase
MGKGATMQAVILVGGKGTRLLPLTCNTPKPMVPVLNRPFMDYVIGFLGEHKINDVIMAMNYLPRAIEDYFGDGHKTGNRIRYCMETSPLDTAGAVKNTEEYIDEGAFFVLNGDIFTNLNFTDMLRYHREKEAKVTIALTPVSDPTNYGLIETTPSGRVTRFLEKPKPEEVTTNMINAGTYILEPEVLGQIPKDTPWSFERKLFPMLLERGEPVYGYSSNAYWIDIGRPEKYTLVHRDLLTQPGLLSPDIRHSLRNEGARINPSARLNGAVVVGDGSEVGEGVFLNGPAVIGPGCVIKEGSIITESIIWQNTRIGAGVKLENALVADACVINDRCALAGVILGDHVTLGSGMRLGVGSRIWPGTMANG